MMKKGEYLYMNKITLNYYPEGKTKAVTMSYDDGQIYDRRLIDIFNRYKIHGTFHLNSSRLDTPGFVMESELSELYKGHEISLHTETHPTFAYIPAETQIHEIIEDRLKLEKAAGYVINGLSYPMGSYDDTVIERVRSLGILYARTTQSTGSFSLPKDFLAWHPTMHHTRGKTKNEIDRNVLMSKAQEYVERPNWYGDMTVFYVWGHSYEFEKDSTWDVIEDFCAFISQYQDIWFATNIEIYNYVTAVRNLRFSADCSMVYNPSSIAVTIGVNGLPITVAGGATMIL